MLANRSDISALKSRFAETGRVLVPGLLTDKAAESVLGAIINQASWTLVTRVEGQHRAFDAAGMDQVPAPQREAFDALVSAEARAGFQYLFERYQLMDEYPKGRVPEGPLLELAELLSGGDFVDLLQAVTGASGSCFVDGQVTRYRAGHFLTEHDDDEPTMHREAAYVMNFTRGWRADLGGLLQFLTPDGHVAEAFVPTFNSVALFKTPAPHAVSSVSNFADQPRLAVTGWLRRS
jgi:SM-20-related protein